MSAAADEQNPKLPGNRLRLLVVGLVFVEAALLIAAAVILLVAAVASDQDSPAALIALAAIALVVGGGLTLCARGVARGLRWSRGPVLTWQLLQAGVAMPLCTSGAWWAGVPLLAVAIVVGASIAGRQIITEDSNRF
jgi:hypothetical protein